MVDAKLYGYVNLKVKKDVAGIIQKLCEEYDIKISDLLFEVLNDETIVTVKLKAKRNDRLKFHSPK